jgi:hypothetical protein
MEKYMKKLHEIFDEMGITLPNWKISLVSEEIIGRSDWAYVTVEIYKPYCKRPCQIRKLAFNFVRKIIDLEKSSFTDL